MSELFSGTSTDTSSSKPRLCDKNCSNSLSVIKRAVTSQLPLAQPRTLAPDAPNVAWEGVAIGNACDWAAGSGCVAAMFSPTIGNTWNTFQRIGFSSLITCATDSSLLFFVTTVFTLNLTPNSEASLAATQIEIKPLLVLLSTALDASKTKPRGQRP